MSVRAYEYRHGGDVYDAEGRSDGRLDFSASINPLGLPDGVAEAVNAALGTVTRYPDSRCGRLRCELARFESEICGIRLEPERILCGNGASDLIFRLAFALRVKTALVTAPAFGDYERACLAAGTEVLHYQLDRERDFALDSGILDMIRSEKPGLLFLCSPNNPNGALIEPELLSGILELCGRTGTYVMADECFLGFCAEAGGYSAAAQLDKYKNLLVLKAFTKLFAMPGIRLGYALSSNIGLLDRLRTAGPDWAVTNLAEAAGLAALSNAGGYIERTRELVAAERGFLMSELEKLTHRVYPSAANFILFEARWGLSEVLLREGVRIRDCSDFRGLGSGFYRVAVRLREDNEKLLAALRKVL